MLEIVNDVPPPACYRLFSDTELNNIKRLLLIAFASRAGARGVVPPSSPQRGACEGIEIELDQHRASFETVASQLPQDEGFSQCHRRLPSC